MVRRGANWKITRGLKGENCQGEGQTGQKIAQGVGALPILPYSYGPPLLLAVTKKIVVDAGLVKNIGVRNLR